MEGVNAKPYTDAEIETLRVDPASFSMSNPSEPIIERLLATVDALKAENERMRKALREIEAKPYRAEEVIARLRSTEDRSQ